MSSTDSSPSVPSQPTIPIPLLALLTSCLSGFALGAYRGADESGLRFAAENAHRVPTTSIGWYFYHKSKNYHVALGGVREGVRLAGITGAWVGVFVGLEASIQRGRRVAGELVRDRRAEMFKEGEKGKTAERRDFLSSVLAGLGTAGLWSAWHRFEIPTAVRTARMGAVVGLTYGLAADAAALLRGRRVSYVDFVSRWLSGRTETGVKEKVAMGT